MNSNNVSSSPTDYAYVQWLTVENLAKHTSSTPPPEVTRAERIAQFQASLIGTNEGILTRRTTRVSFPPRGKSSKRSRDTSCSGNSNNIAIDVFPLPFPYHNDAFFLPVVESGHTRYDSSSRACSVLAATPVSDRRSQRTSSSSINSFIINLSSSPSSRPARPSSFLPHPNNRSSSTPPNLVWWRQCERGQVSASRMRRDSSCRNVSRATLSTIHSIRRVSSKNLHVCSTYNRPPPPPSTSPSSSSSTSITCMTATASKQAQQQQQRQRQKDTKSFGSTLHSIWRKTKPRFLGGGGSSSSKRTSLLK